eukprot:2944418-Pyramimonas_sp.AAC.1
MAQTGQLLGAKHAIGLHASSAAANADMDRRIRAARCTLRLAARLLLSWGPIDLSGAELIKVPPAASVPLPHAWGPWSGAWRRE